MAILKYSRIKLFPFYSLNKAGNMLVVESNFQKFVEFATLNLTQISSHKGLKNDIKLTNL